MRSVSILVITAALLVSGCLEETSLPGADDVADVGLLLTAAKEPLWVNPQTYPHPAFNFPTLTNPASGASVPEFWAPIPSAELPSTIKGIDLFAAAPKEVESGAGMSVFGSLAVVPGYSDKSYVLDIRDPAAPALLSTIEGNHRNVDFIAYPTGRLVAIFSTDASTLNVWDLTDPRMPEKLTDIKPKAGTHKVNVVPGTPIVYNANSRGGATDPLGATPTGHLKQTRGGITEIYDLSDPAQPELVKEWKNGNGCHHIYFWNNAEAGKFRAICAGIEYTQIWDTADPRDPKIVVEVPVHHGNPNAPSASVFLMAFSHFSILSADGETLIVGDEMGGGLPPGCTAPGAPTGALWFYDVKDEKNPVLKGWFSPGQPMRAPSAGGSPFSTIFGGSCTAHHGRLVPDPEGKRDLLAMAFYGAGTVLVDFTNPAMPKQVDQFAEGTNTWEAQYYNGYVFTGDLARGMDVLKLV